MPAPLALQATGGVDLALLDPILAPQGRRARGQVALNASIAGTTAAPQVNGTLTLAGGEVQDLGQGVRVSAIAATIQATGQTDPDRKLQRPGRPGHDHRQRHRRAHRGDACRSSRSRCATGTAARQ